MTIRELIKQLNQIPKEYLDYGVLLEPRADLGDNLWLESTCLQTQGGSGYEEDGCLELYSDSYTHNFGTLLNVIESEVE